MKCLVFSLFLAVPPLFVIEFLHRIVDTFKEYFSECTEQRIKDNYVIVYEVRLSNNVTASHRAFFD